MLANERRGCHSYGFSADGIVRKAAKPISRMSRKELKSLARAQTVMAHTRHATHGAVTANNAHPFEIGGIVGAHNGVVSNHWALNTEFGRRYDVDSQHIFRHLADGIPLDTISAYGAISWYDLEEYPVVNLARFNGGELAMSRGAWGCAWSSERKDLDTAMRYAGLRHERLSVPEGIVLFARDGQAWTGNEPITIGKPMFATHWSRFDEDWEETRDSGSRSWYSDHKLVSRK
jgi:hypothetical protein